MKIQTEKIKVQEIKGKQKTKFIYIPNKVVKYLNLKKGEEVLVSFQKHYDIKSYRCHACNHIFDYSDDIKDLYCPACECTDLEELK